VEILILLSVGLAIDTDLKSLKESECWWSILISLCGGKGIEISPFSSRVTGFLVS
jgi:hypothetical protein